MAHGGSVRKWLVRLVLVGGLMLLGVGGAWSSTPPAEGDQLPATSRSWSMVIDDFNDDGILDIF